MSYLLYIETSAETCSVCLAKGDTVLSELLAPKIQSHSEKLTLLIQEILLNQNVSTTELSGIGLSVGPGSYTGLRVGSSVARGLSLALDIPIITISTLHALASQYFDGNPNTLIVPMIDARRDEVYHAVYNGLGETLTTPVPIIVDEAFLAAYIDDISIHTIILCGDGTDKPLPPLNNSLLQIKPTKVLASHLVYLGFDMFCSHQFADTAYFDLEYIKSPNITTSKKNLLHK